LPGILVIDALDVEAHAEHLDRREMVAALHPHHAVLTDPGHLKRLQLAGGEGGLGVSAIFFTSQDVGVGRHFEHLGV